MRSEIFEIDFSRTQVLIVTLIPVIINISVFLYVSLFTQRTRITGYFSFFVFMLGMWQVSEGFVQMSITPEAAEFWHRVSVMAVIFAVLFGLLFSLNYTKLDKKISWNIFFIFLVLPAIVFVICLLGHLDKNIVVSSAKWHWIVNPQPIFITLVIFLWISIGGFLMLLLFWTNYFIAGKSSEEKKQSYILATGITIPVVIGIIFEVIFPLILKIDGIPITASFTTIFSVLALVAIKKFHMLDFSPKHHWDDIINSMSEGILIVDNNDEIKYANEPFSRLSGYEFSEMEGKNATQLFVNNRNVKDKVNERIENRKRKISDQYEIQIITKFGEKKWLLVGGSPYIDKNGKVIGSIGIHANIDERKEAEESLIETNKELEIFIYKVSHDLRGPLASIIGLVNVSKYEIKDELSNKYLRMIESSTQKLDHTLKELVKTMRIKDTERFDDKINFNELIDSILSEFEFFKGFSRLKITKSVSLSSPLYSNKFLLETIIQNLIENSIKYQDVTNPDSYLNIKVEDCNDGIQIVIEDNGIGIKSSVQGLIFDMYFKAVESSNGSGLGLYLVKKCVEKLGGEIILKSTLGNGTNFTIVMRPVTVKHKK